MSSRSNRSAAAGPALAATAVVAALTALVVLLGAAPATGYAGTVSATEWQLTSLHARLAWRVSTGAGVVVAVLDSGVDVTHADLAGQVLPGADFVDGSTDGRKDFVGHGTTVAGLIAGRERFGGVTGLAPNAKILPVRVLDKNNRYSDATTVARGMRWAVDHGAQVVNLSLGGNGRSLALADAIQYAIQHDVVVVACTGNLTDGSTNEVWYPAREPGVIAVSGLVQSRGSATNRVSLWPEAITGPATVLTAPAVDMLGAKPGGYWRVQGTSFAAPLVAAAAALVRSHWPDMNVANVINRLIGTAQDLGPRGRDATFGYGEVDPLAALTASIPAVTADPLEPHPSSPARPLPGTSAAPRSTAPVASVLHSGRPVPMAAVVPEVSGPVAWGLGAGILVFIAAVGAGLTLVRRRLPEPGRHP